VALGRKIRSIDKRAYAGKAAADKAAATVEKARAREAQKQADETKAMQMAEAHTAKVVVTTDHEGIAGDFCYDDNDHDHDDDHDDDHAHDDGGNTDVWNSQGSTLHAVGDGGSASIAQPSNPQSRQVPMPRDGQMPAGKVLWIGRAGQWVLASVVSWWGRRWRGSGQWYRVRYVDGTAEWKELSTATRAVPGHDEGTNWAFPEDDDDDGAEIGSLEEAYGLEPGALALVGGAAGKQPSKGGGSGTGNCDGRGGASAVEVAVNGTAAPNLDNGNNAAAASETGRRCAGVEMEASATGVAQLHALQQALLKVKAEKAEAEAALHRRDAEIAGLKRALTDVELIDADSGASGVMQGPVEEPPLKRRRLAEKSGAHLTQALARQVEIKREEVADEQDERGYQVRFTDALQSKFDELAKVAIAGGADAAAVCACRAGR
jgi:hypothetical protein